MQVAGEYVGVFVDGSVLDDVTFRLFYLETLFHPAAQKIDLEVERPAVHVFVEVGYVGVARLLEKGGAAEPVGKHLGQRGLAAAYIS